MENKNHGVLVSSPRKTDYIFGSTSPITISRVINDWSLYLPKSESQRDSQVDFLECVTMSAGHSIEMQLNYLLGTNQLSDEALNFFHNNGYIVDGVFHISKRYNAKLNGTDKTNGQQLPVAGDSFRVVGFVPESDWPTTNDMTWSEFYKDIPINLIQKGKQALWYILIQYQWVTDLSTLKLSPVQVATEICPGWDSGKMVGKCSGQPIQHATIVYGLDAMNNWLDFDQYPPYLQTLAHDYEFPYNMQYVVTSKAIVLRRGMIGSNVLAYQKNMNRLGYNLVEDSHYGSITETATRNFQNKTGLAADGAVGPLTFGKLSDMIKDSPLDIKDIIKDTCNQNGVEPELGIAVATAESGLDPKSINKNTNGSIDRGIFQWNNRVFPEITDSMAFDPKISTQKFCEAVLAGHLHSFWYLSEPNWKKSLSSAILSKYHINN